MTAPRRTGKRYWNTHSDGGGTWRTEAPPGADLAALRRGIGREPGTVPEMWPFLRSDLEPAYDGTRSDRWTLPSEAVAEHHALALFGVHQQSTKVPVHRSGVSLGTAIRRLHTSERFTSEAVDRRFYALVTADEIGEVANHLHGLIRMLHSLPRSQGLDYDEVDRSLRSWQFDESRAAVRRRWGLAYHARIKDSEATAADAG